MANKFNLPARYGAGEKSVCSRSSRSSATIRAQKLALQAAHLRKVAEVERAEAEARAAAEAKATAAATEAAAAAAAAVAERKAADLELEAQIAALEAESGSSRTSRSRSSINKWVEYIQLAAEYKPAVNLGQGFPDYPPPDHVTKALAEVATGDNPLFNQYTRGFGHPRLVQNLAKVYSPLIGRELDPFNEILVSTGAYEALFSAILGHVDTGDEVIVIEPYFDCYDYMITSAGGKSRFIALKPKPKGDQMTSADWVLDENELASLFNERTKMIILNTPHNPLGKIFTQSELELIANLCKKHNVLCLSDEVYEWMVYEPQKHIRIATFPGMWERTITVGSAGKTFSVTGWKIGWAYGPANLMRNLQVVHQNCVYTCVTPIQEAVARAFEFELARYNSPDCYFFSLAKELLPKRDYLVKTLRENGFNPTVPEGGYFIIADWTKLADKIDLSSEKDKYRDYRFTKKFAKEAGVLAIPPTAFYSEDHKPLGENYARFCFIKKDENLQLTNKLLKEWNAKK